MSTFVPRPAEQFALLNANLSSPAFSGARTLALEQQWALARGEGFDPNVLVGGLSLAVQWLKHLPRRADPLWRQEEDHLKVKVFEALLEAGWSPWPRLAGSFEEPPEVGAGTQFLSELLVRDQFVLLERLLTFAPEKRPPWGQILNLNLGTTENPQPLRERVLSEPVLLRTLLEAGLPVNLCDGNDRTLLFHARSPSALKILKEYGIDPTVRDRGWNTAYTHQHEERSLGLRPEAKIWHDLGLISLSDDEILIALRFGGDIGGLLCGAFEDMRARADWRTQEEDGRRPWGALDALTTSVLASEKPELDGRSRPRKELTNLLAHRSEPLDEMAQAQLYLVCAGWEEPQQFTEWTGQDTPPSLQAIEAAARNHVVLSTRFNEPSAFPESLYKMPQPLWEAFLDGWEQEACDIEMSWNFKSYPLPFDEWTSAREHLDELSPRHRALIEGIHLRTRLYRAMGSDEEEQEYAVLNQENVPRLAQCLHQSKMEAWPGLVTCLPALHRQNLEALLRSAAALEKTSLVSRPKRRPSS